jgi:hypothetical protein
MATQITAQELSDISFSLPTSTSFKVQRWGGFFNRVDDQTYAWSSKSPVERMEDAFGWTMEQPESTHQGVGGGYRPTSLTRVNAVSRRVSRPITRYQLDDVWRPRTPVPEKISTLNPETIEMGSPVRCTGVDQATQTGEFIPISFPELQLRAETQPTDNAAQQNEPVLDQIGIWEDEKTEASVPSDYNNLKAEIARLQTVASTLETQIAGLVDENRNLKDRLLPHAQKSDTTSGDFSNLVSGWIDTMEDRQKLMMERVTLCEEKRALEKEILNMDSRNKELEKMVEQQDDVLKALISDMKARQSTPVPESSPALGDFTTTTDAFKKYWSDLRQAGALVAALGISPRIILLCKLFQLAEERQAMERRNKFSHLAYVAYNSLETILNPPQALEYFESLKDSNINEGVRINICSICRLPKFFNAPSLKTSPAHSRFQTLRDFHPRLGKTSCCSKAICISCLPSAIISRVSKDWWHNLGSPYWIQCPVPGCKATMPLRYNVDLTNLLRSLGDQNVLYHVQQFDRANCLRGTLESLLPRPSPEACRVAQALHDRLIKYDLMYPLLDLRNVYNLGIQMLPVDSPDGRRSLSVPIFTSLLKRQTTPRECVVCAEGIYDLDFQDEKAWEAACKGFEGDWTWNIRAFPTKTLLLVCGTRHSLDICRGCIACHLASKLDELGSAGCDRLVCPTVDCGHTYSYAEVKALASPETFARYDKYRLLGHLATLPNFRWCLREGCHSGQIYDMPEDPSGRIAETIAYANGLASAHNQIRCDDCSFLMCFRHQVPWHNGLSCEAYDSEQTPEFAATRNWISANTKACPGPGCGIPTEKNAGCFHMTCRECNFEFCWECLADWKDIYKGAGRYDWAGHNVGCYFRARSVPQPTTIMGNTIHEAVRGGV